MGAPWFFCYLRYKSHGAQGSHVTEEDDNGQYYDVQWMYTDNHQDFVITDVLRHFYDVPGDLPVGVCVSGAAYRKCEEVLNFEISDESYEMLRQEVIKKFKAERLNNLFE